MIEVLNKYQKEKGEDGLIQLHEEDECSKRKIDEIERKIKKISIGDDEYDKQKKLQEYISINQNDVTE